MTNSPDSDSGSQSARSSVLSIVACERSSAVEYKRVALPMLRSVVIILLSRPLSAMFPLTGMVRLPAEVDTLSLNSSRVVADEVACRVT